MNVVWSKNHPCVLFCFILFYLSVLSWVIVDAQQRYSRYSFTLQAIFNEKIFLRKCHPKGIASLCKQSLMKRYFFVSVIQKITRNLKGLTREAIAIHTSVIINLYSMIIRVCVCLCVWVCVWLGLSYTWCNSMQCWIILSCHQSIV